jgi:chromosome segregation ATPase
VEGSSDSCPVPIADLKWLRVLQVMRLQGKLLALQQQTRDARMQAGDAREAAERHERESLAASEHVSALEDKLEATTARLEGLQHADKVHPVLLLPS